MKLKTLISLACVAFGFSLSATAQTASVTSTLDKVQQSGTLRACATGDYKPFSFLKPDGSYEGIDIDLAQSLATSLGVKLQVVKTTWSTLMSDFTAGQCDMVLGGVSVTLDRQKKAAFTAPYMVDGKSAIARCDSVAKFQTLADIDKPDVRVVVNPGGTNERFARANLKQAKLTVYPDNVTIFDQIVKGEADVMITDTSETLVQHKLRPSLCAVNPDKPFQYGEKAWMLPRDDAAFKAYVDQWLHLARATGEFDAVMNRWLH